MSKQWQIRRGTTAENDAFIGAEGEITVDLNNKEARIHTGDNKAGGYGVARKDFNNITDEAKNIANWSSNITNCITEIPQDINLTLSSGTLTLKSGSKVYMPNGTGIFNIINVNSDKTFTYSTNGKYIIVLTINGDMNRCSYPAVSGNTEPTASAGILWYDTANNLVKRNDGTQWQNRSFPIAVITVSNGVISSIDQVFNGFGYIGSTIFALPKVKGLIPNGRNADGTLKNTAFTTSSVITTQLRGTYYNMNGIVGQRTIYAANTYDYDSKINRVYNTQSGSVYGDRIIWGTVDIVSDKIISVRPKTAFYAVDYSDTEYIGHQAMPSNKYIDLTLPASGNTVTAPADGYITASKLSTVAGEYFIMVNSTNSMNAGSMSSAALNLRCFIPVSKGDVVTITYTATGVTNFFRFIYANGSK